MEGEIIIDFVCEILAYLGKGNQPMVTFIIIWIRRLRYNVGTAPEHNLACALCYMTDTQDRIM